MCARVQLFIAVGSEASCRQEILYEDGTSGRDGVVQRALKPFENAVQTIQAGDDLLHRPNASKPRARRLHRRRARPWQAGYQEFLTHSGGR